MLKKNPPVREIFYPSADQKRLRNAAVVQAFSTQSIFPWKFITMWMCLLVAASSREASPHRQNGPNSAPRFTSSLETSPASSSCSASPLPPDPDDDDEEDEFIDTVEVELFQTLILIQNYTKKLNLLLNQIYLLLLNK